MPPKSTSKQHAAEMKGEFEKASDFLDDEDLDRTLFTELDQHAKYAPITSATSYSELTDYLSAKFPKDKRKRQLYLARGLLVWLCYHKNRVHLFEDVGNCESPLRLLTAQTKDARAFQVLCEKNDIECKIVSGIVRGVVGYEVGDTDTKTRGEWNVVKLDGTWRLIHSKWACSTRVGHQTGGWIKKESDGISTTERIESRSGNTISEFSDHWFCTKPTTFLHRCYPDEPIWQLVPANKQVQSVVEFLKLPYLKHTYFDLGLHLTSEYSCLLTVDGCKEEITFHMGTRGLTNQRLSYSLYVKDEMESTTENITDRMVLNWQDVTKETSSFELRFPVAGAYKLKLHVTDHDAGSRLRLGEFKIICKAPTKDFRPLPIDPPYGWGFTYKASEYGLANPSMTSPKIPIKATENKKQKPENIASLMFTIKKNLVDSVGYQSSLHGGEYSDEENASLQQYVKTNVNKRALQLTVQATVPVAGEFALVIDAVTTEPRLESNVPVCTYLLTTLEKRDEFLDYHFMVQLKADLQDKWFKILLLMGITFKTIEDALGRKYGSTLQEHITGFLLDWKDINKTRDDCGLPYLLAALKKGEQFELAKDITIKLRSWYRNDQNRNSAFYKWLTQAYINTSLFDLVDDYPEPMSDLYLVMLASDINPSEEFFRALHVSDTTVSDVMNNGHVYVTDEMVVMKIFVHFRDGIPDKPKALKKLIQVFESHDMMDKRKYALISAKAWSIQATDRHDKLKLDVQEFMKTVKY